MNSFLFDFEDYQISSIAHSFININVYIFLEEQVIPKSIFLKFQSANFRINYYTNNPASFGTFLAISIPTLPNSPIRALSSACARFALDASLTMVMS